MALTLLTTKFRVPKPTHPVVGRSRLFTLLENGLKAKLLLVSAPAGAGKSTTLAAWLEQLDKPSAWLSLEPSDNDLGRFLLYLVSALQQLAPNLGLGLTELLQQQSTVNAEPLLIQLTNDLAQLDDKLVLVLDDYHALTDPKIHDAIEFLLDHMPSQLCLGIATRSDPPLALPRLRVRNQLLEVRGADLRFDITEATQFLNGHLELELSADAIARLEARTEGWIAALQLAGLSLTRRTDKEEFVASFAGSHRFLVDYLGDEVLKLQSPQMQAFLQRTSILERFTASLCEAVTQQSTSTELLGQLETNNLFLIPLDDERKWYRFHHLFAEYLQDRLQAAEASLIPELHRRASAWFESENWHDEAIQHAFLAADDKLAAQLIDSVAAELILNWNNKQLIEYVQQLPASLLPLYPRLCIFYSWSLTNTGQVSKLTKVLPLLEASRAHSREPRTIDATVVTLRAYERLWKRDFAETDTLCQRALSLLEPPQGISSDVEGLALVAATNLRAYSYLHSDLMRANRIYPIAAETSKKFGNFVGVANSYARWGRVKHQLGQLQEAMDVFSVGLGELERRRAEVGVGKKVINVGELHLNLAWLFYEWNHLDEVEFHLKQAQGLSELSMFTPVAAFAHKTAFYLHQARGETNEAYVRLNKLDRLRIEVHPDNLFQKRMIEVIAMELRLSLAALQPDFGYLLDDVQKWVRSRAISVEDSFDYVHENSRYILARLHMLQDRQELAYSLLGRLAKSAERGGRTDDLIRALSLQALATRTQDQAREALKRALTLAEAEGYIRIFVDHGPLMQHLIEQVAKYHSTPHITKLLLAFPEAPKDYKPSLAPLPVQVTFAGGGDYLEPLNERERSVLQLLAVGNTYKQIAKELQLSPNTVRWYMQSIYSKLHAGNRTEAVNRARSAGLL